ncbi:MAG: peptidase T [Candidatus Aegiribacteria sp.]|nr:peptidase T [Candidatus Aegiribacteria sp.]
MSELTDRFLRYVRMNTASDPSSSTSPSSARQIEFLRMLEIEFSELGMDDIELDAKGTLYASLPGGGCGDTVIGLLAHVDTSPEAPGENVNPVLHRNWDGKPIELCEGVVIKPSETVDMLRYVGDTIITSDGTTLLGADDKAGVAIIMEILDTLINKDKMPVPPLRIAFSTDEEVGRGMDNFDPARFGADLAYTVDGGSVGKVDTQTFNAWSADWKVKGREVHPGSAKGIMVNASRVLADIVSSILPEEMPENSSGDEGYYYPLSISSVTSEGNLKMILRDFTTEGMKSRIETMRSLEKWIQVKYPGAEISLEMQEQYSNPGEILEQDRRAVEFALRATGNVGLESEESSIRGGTDGSRLSFMGIPTVNLPTGGELFHSRNEWIAFKGLELSYRIVLETLRIWGAQ